MKIINKTIELLIYSFENLQYFFNTEIYSIIRLKKGDNLNKFLNDIFLISYKKWLKEYYHNEDLSIIHNITYNYWIRSFASLTLINKNPIKKFIYNLTKLFYTFNLLIFILNLLISRIVIIEDKSYKLKKSIDYKDYFITSLNNKRFSNLLEEIESNYSGTKKVNIKNIRINTKLFENFFFNKMDNNKFFTLNLLLNYIRKYPFIIKYHKTLYESLYLYNLYMKSEKFYNQYALFGEIYSMESRALSIASLDRNKKSYFIDYTKFDALPYDRYSLNRNTKLISLNEILLFNNHNKNYNSNKLKRNIIVIQASDGCGTISSYELKCYKDIINALNKINFQGKLYFKFHPANLKLSVILKKIYCKNLLDKKQKIQLLFFHDEIRIEDLAKDSKLLISIDYSTSFEEINKKRTPIIYYNLKKKRHFINQDNKLNKSELFTMLFDNEELILKLKKLI